MPLELETYATQRARWPHDGKVILAQYDDTSVVVYQAFHAVTAEHAVRHGRLGGPRYSGSSGNRVGRVERPSRRFRLMG
jgi:hypothetical protein